MRALVERNVNDGVVGETRLLAPSSGVGEGALVHLGHDGVADTLKLAAAVLVLVLGGLLVGVEPVHGEHAGLGDGLLITHGHLLSDVVDGVAHGEGVVLELAASLDAIALVLVGGLELDRKSVV